MESDETVKEPSPPVPAPSPLPTTHKTEPAHDLTAKRAAPTHTHCANCGTALQGPYCHICGQATKDVLRHLPGLAADAADLVFNFDGRIMRTVPALYFHPGRLTLEYFAGKRVRYITPFRLVFLLAIIAFFAFQVGTRASFSQAEPWATVSAPGGFHVAINHTPATGGSTAPTPTPPPTPAKDDQPSQKERLGKLAKPVQIAGLPAFVDTWLTDAINHGREHVDILRFGSSAQRKAEARNILLGMFAVAPTVLFVLLPIFALMLQVFYVLKRRLYIEHLIVAMHSHAFLLLSTLVLLLESFLQSWLLPHAHWLAVPLGLLAAATWIWMFVYLYLMQKHVYRQGWVMTTLKFGCIGFCYSLLLVFALIAVSLLSLTR